MTDEARDPTVNPIIYGTDKEYAWDAYQRGFGSLDVRGMPIAGGLLPDHVDFEDWWMMFGLGYKWQNLREMIGAAWSKGVQNRNVQGTAGFNAYWQEIVAAQPVIGEAKPA